MYFKLFAVGVVLRYVLLMYDTVLQVFAWGDNDHGQQGNSTTTVNRKPALVHGLEGYKITRVACGSSHSISWATTDLSTPTSHEPVLFSSSRDPLGASLLGKSPSWWASLFMTSLSHWGPHCLTSPFWGVSCMSLLGGSRVSPSTFSLTK